MDITLVVIVSFILLAFVFLFLFLFKSINKKSFLADDGSIFSNQSDLDKYQRLYEKTKSLFSVVEDIDSNQNILGFDKSFLTKVRSAGFRDLKTIFQYRIQLKKLSDLINS